MGSPGEELSGLISHMTPTHTPLPAHHPAPSEPGPVLGTGANEETELCLGRCEVGGQQVGVGGIHRRIAGRNSAGVRASQKLQRAGGTLLPLLRPLPAGDSGS